MQYVCDCCDCVCDSEYDGANNITDDEVICDRCFDSNYCYCDECGDIILIDDSFEWDNTICCESCYNKMVSKLGVHKHSYSPSLSFHSYYETVSRQHNPYVGIELEIQGRNRNKFCKEMKDEYGNEDIFYMKVDGSLDNERGVEIVSNPMTYKYITNENHFKNLFDKLINYEMDDTTNCGLHFHIDREYLNDDDIFVIDYIVNRFETYFSSIGGREFGRYCKKREDENFGERNYDRYVAVNLENSDTIELRFCKSTFSYETFMKRVKMIFAIIHFAKENSSMLEKENLKKMDGKTFVQKFKDVLDKLG